MTSKMISRQSVADRPLAAMALFFCAGIVLDKFWPRELPAYILTGFIVLVLAAIVIRRKTLCGILILLSFVSLGAVVSRQFQYVPPDDIVRVAKYYRGQSVSVEGVIVSDIQKRSVFRTVKTSFELRVTRLTSPWGWKKKTGKILVNIFRDVSLNYGDSVRIEGKLHRPFRSLPDSKFSYADYLKARKIHLILSVKKTGRLKILSSGGGWFLKFYSIRLKNRIKDIFDTYLTPSEAGLMQALIIGDRYDIPQNIMNLFVQTGTAHILAISGFNVGIIAYLLFIIFRLLPIGRKAQLVGIIVVLIFYAVLTGLRPPVVRATIMATVFLLSFLVEREADVISSLSFAAFLILIVNPLYLFDVGFQLSFLSVLSMVLFYQSILSALSRGPGFLQRQPFLFCLQSLSVSLAAWTGVAGLIAYYFGIITPVTILANLVVIPLISLVIVLGLGMLAFFAVPACAAAFAVCLKVLLNLTVAGIYLFSFVPGGYFYLSHVSVWAVAGYYGAVASFGVLERLLRGLTKKFNYGTVNPMKKVLLQTALAVLLLQSNALAFWIWTPETNRWINPKYDVKDDPEEQLEFAKGFYDAKEYKKAVLEFEKLIRHYPKSKEAAEAQYLIGLSYEDQIRIFEAFKAYQKVVEKYPFSARFTEIIERQFKIGERLMNGEGRSGKFVSALLGSDYDVIDVFRTVIKNAPYGKYSAPSQYQIGLYLSEKGLFQEARDEFEKVINDYPDSEWVKAAKYQIAVVDAKRSTDAQYDQKVTKTAVEEFKEFAAIYPDAELSEKAQAQIRELREKEAENNFLIGKYYEKTKKFKAAKIYYETIVRDYNSSPWAAKASERLKDLALKDQ